MIDRHLDFAQSQPNLNWDQTMFKQITSSILILLMLFDYSAIAACCYFAAKDKDILQPAQKAFIVWHPDEKIESFTVQPKFEGNANDFGMVVPTPSQPKLNEMPREFFKELAVFTILESMDLSKYKQLRLFKSAVRGASPSADQKKKSTVRVLESGVVGSLDYKIIVAEQASDLFTWLKDNKYNYAGDEKTLDYYIKKKWFFTVMKIDPKQMKRRKDGNYSGEVTPTRFTFESDRLIYPLKITQLSVRDKTEALFYVAAPQKMDLPEDFSYQHTWSPMWMQAISFAIPAKVTEQEAKWRIHLQPRVTGLRNEANKLRRQKRIPATLEWAKKIKQKDIDVLAGLQPYNRTAPKKDVQNLKILQGHIKKGQYITKLRKIFRKEEMNADLVFVPARIDGQRDGIEYYSILPTSPP